VIPDETNSEETQATTPEGMAEDDCLTIAEIAAKLKVGKSKVRGWIASGRLRAYNVGAGKKRPRFRVSRGDLRRFLLTRRTMAGLAPGRRPYHRRHAGGNNGVKQFF
jgi:excisionase family DNA binding protein